MSIRRTIYCNVEGCDNSYTEKQPNDGFPQWGVLQGKQNEKGETDFHACPEHFNKLFDFASKMRG